MPSIIKLDRPSIALLMRDLAETAKKHGVHLAAAGGRIDNDADATLKIRCRITDSGMIEDHQRQDFTSWCHAYRLQPEDYRATFIHQGRPYKLIGFNMNAPKFCISGERSDGKVFRFPRTVLSKLVRAKVAA